MTGPVPRVPPLEQRAWGYLGAAAAAWFAIWMLFFPAFVPTHFAWDAQPRYAQAFIGAGYIFRTAFFLNAAREPNWLRLRWMVWGNLAFTGTLLFATYWHLSEFKWNPFETPVAHIWIVLYVFEPIAMLAFVPRRVFAVDAPTSRGPIGPMLRRFLVLLTGVLVMFGLLLVVNPEFAAMRWPWELNPLDARIVAAWFLGWAGWCAAMSRATDWDEIRRPAQLFVLNGLALVATVVAFRGELLARGTATGYAVAVAVMTGVMLAFYWLHERRRPALVA